MTRQPAPGKIFQLPSRESPEAQRKSLALAMRRFAQSPVVLEAPFYACVYGNGQEDFFHVSPLCCFSCLFFEWQKLDWSHFDARKKWFTLNKDLNKPVSNMSLSWEIFSLRPSALGGSHGRDVQKTLRRIGPARARPWHDFQASSTGFCNISVCLAVGAHGRCWVVLSFLFFQSPCPVDILLFRWKWRNQVSRRGWSVCCMHMIPVCSNSQFRSVFQNRMISKGWPRHKAVLYYRITYNIPVLTYVHLYIDSCLVLFTVSLSIHLYVLVLFDWKMI